MNMSAKTLGILIASLSLLPLAACQKKQEDTRMSDASRPPSAAPAPENRADTAPPPAASTMPPPAPAPGTPAKPQEPQRPTQ